MIQKYTTKTASENRCDEVEDRWDESGIWCENKKRPSGRFEIIQTHLTKVFVSWDF